MEEGARKRRPVSDDLCRRAVLWAYSATWGAGGTIVFASGSGATRGTPGLMRVLAAGSTPQPLTKPQGEIHVDPSFLPDGKALFFVIQRPGMPDRIAVLSLETGEH